MIEVEKNEEAEDAKKSQACRVDDQGLQKF
jgi:hypothetical protein